MLGKRSEMKHPGPSKIPLRGGGAGFRYRMKSGETLEILLDDGDPIRNVPESVQGEGHRVLDQERFGDHWRVLIEKA
ncbi:MAG: sulfurtransferase TusA family protein [Deltaproteobacteria bacterium]|nr:MAG: sulfurtransferase TusA family protein [Deltaproteobacteria bacterium]